MGQVAHHTNDNGEAFPMLFLVFVGTADDGIPFITPSLDSAVSCVNGALLDPEVDEDDIALYAARIVPLDFKRAAFIDPDERRALKAVAEQINPPIIAAEPE